jgi:hypothetical protein
LGALGKNNNNAPVVLDLQRVWRQTTLSLVFFLFPSCPTTTGGRTRKKSNNKTQTNKKKN